MGLTLLLSRLSIAGFKQTDDIAHSYTYPLRLPIAMSTTKADIPHLTRQSLSSDDQRILVGIAGWLSKAKFEKINADNFELCVDDELSEKLLKDIDLVQKVWQGIPN